MNADQAMEALRQQGGEFIVLTNLAGVYPPYDIVPLAPKQTRVPGDLLAVLFDMDGTTTLTEDICMYSLDYALRRMALNADGTSRFPGLSHERDYPHIIGRSASNNAEYLMQAYGELFNDAPFKRAYLKASAWNLNAQRDVIRQADAQATLIMTGGAAVLADPVYQALVARAGDDPLPEDVFDSVPEAAGWLAQLRLDHHEERLRAALDIYYERLHSYFHWIRLGRGSEVARDVYSDANRAAIAPLPGIGVAFALARGWVPPSEAEAFAKYLADGVGITLLPEHVERIVATARWTAQRKVMVGLVTSSGLYEATTVLYEVFKGLRLEVERWPVSPERRAFFAERFATAQGFYDTIVTADNSHEIRLKPYRDLYTIAAQQLGIKPHMLKNVVGFEDTWAGVTAMRGAGIGVPCAVPFEGTTGHDFRAAAHVFAKGLSQAMLEHGLFLRDEVLASQQ
jgi:beta-phosphoglucomutase-like phosphatase (HAD superfamily)